MRYRLTSLHTDLFAFLSITPPPQWHPGRFLLSPEPHSLRWFLIAWFWDFSSVATSEEGGKGSSTGQFGAKTFGDDTTSEWRLRGELDQLLNLLYCCFPCAKHRAWLHVAYLGPCQGSCRFCWLIHLSSHRFCGHRPRTRNAHNTSTLLDGDGSRCDVSRYLCLWFFWEGLLSDDER